MTAVENMQPWNKLHTQRRHALNYPAEPVVRFLQSAKTNAFAVTVLDVGCGAGRHMKLAAELGLEPYGIDSSVEAVRQAAKHGQAEVGEMTAMPCREEAFDLVLCYGTIYYGTKDATHTTAGEIHRVMKTGGHGLITLRTVHDWRMSHGVEIGERTIRFEHDDQPEDGMVMNFADLDDIKWFSGLFTLVDVNALEETKSGMTRRESDWLVVVRKEPTE